ncbi:ubiquitin-like modifier [Drepanopeziza brunnea f. sp. 'multigermtubi' MB_m1]|uniref:Ubiquitin-like modifier n=1 Tax=Marssonina brunnea f. sp. multigermtubi (strain MB_m1) TaxID=1072389 RepID=K1WTP5_MARBU|nr:ubiquitin-like modifier [Drepanopeziza brunnea f. sp. 'multigermtubi' MB_m1]EKD11958.1 ubiquitin-like modifier [Drepanopeziza brunnea f. sp. 'multigermtubi' MB_m1]
MPSQGEPEAPAANSEDSNNSVISIKVKEQNEAEMLFKIKTKAKLCKVFNAYCDSAGLKRSTVRFLLDESRVQEEDTPETLQLDDGDMIDAMLEQLVCEGTPSADDKLEASKANAPVHIKIKVKNQHGSEVTFKMKRTTPLEKVMDAFCSRQEIDIKSVRFLFEGQRVQPTDTPISLEMEDEDIIEVFIEQLGGEFIEVEVRPLAASGRLRIIVKNETGDEVTFLMKKSATFGRLLAAYCQRLEINTTSVRFLWKGSRVQLSDTPASLTFEDGEIFKVFKEQGGPDPINATAEKEVAGPVIPTIITIALVNGDFRLHVHKLLFKLKLTTKLRRLMDVYCERQGVESHMVRFFAGGTRICDDDTPRSLELEDNHVIEVFAEQIGGGAEEGDDAAAGDEQVAKSKAHKLSIKVVNDRGEEVVFQCRPTTLLQKLIDTYCASKDRKPSSLRFFTPGGQRLMEGSTPASLGMKDGDIIDVHEEQQGGGF